MTVLLKRILFISFLPLVALFGLTYIGVAQDADTPVNAGVFPPLPEGVTNLSDIARPVTNIYIANNTFFYFPNFLGRGATNDCEYAEGRQEGLWYIDEGEEVNAKKVFGYIKSKTIGCVYFPYNGGEFETAVYGGSTICPDPKTPTIKTSDTTNLYNEEPSPTLRVSGCAYIPYISEVIWLGEISGSGITLGGSSVSASNRGVVPKKLADTNNLSLAGCGQGRFYNKWSFGRNGGIHCYGTTNYDTYKEFFPEEHTCYPEGAPETATDFLNIIQNNCSTKIKTSGGQLVFSIFSQSARANQIINTTTACPTWLTKRTLKEKTRGDLKEEYIFPEHKQTNSLSFSATEKGEVTLVCEDAIGFGFGKEETEPIEFFIQASFIDLFSIDNQVLPAGGGEVTVSWDVKHLDPKSILSCSIDKTTLSGEDLLEEFDIVSIADAVPGANVKSYTGEHDVGEITFETDFTIKCTSCPLSEITSVTTDPDTGVVTQEKTYKRTTPCNKVAEQSITAKVLSDEFKERRR